VLLVDSVLDGLEVASRLAAEDIAIAGSRALREAAHRIAELVPPPQIVDGDVAIGRSIGPRTSVRPGRDRATEPAPASADSASDNRPIPAVTAPTSGVPVIAAPGRDPRAIVWLDADRASLAKSLGDRPATTALVSARAHAGPGTGAGYDAAMAWASAADRAQLLAWIEATSAREVFVTGPCAESIVAALGTRARLIGPPQQMQLFPREATS
jgi:hypothetical protein